MSVQPNSLTYIQASESAFQLTKDTLAKNNVPVTIKSTCSIGSMALTSLLTPTPGNIITIAVTRCLPYAENPYCVGGTILLGGTGLLFSQQQIQASLNQGCILAYETAEDIHQNTNNLINDPNSLKLTFYNDQTNPQNNFSSIITDNSNLNYIKSALDIFTLFLLNEYMKNNIGFSSSSVTQVITPTETYTVNSGDSLWAIAQKHNKTLDELLTANPWLADRTNEDKSFVLIKPGDLLTIPGEGEFDPGDWLPDIEPVIPPSLNPLINSAQFCYKQAA